MVNRRTFLSSAGALAAFGGTHIASAQSQRDELTTAEVSQAFQKGIMEDGEAGARQAWEELGLDPAIEVTQDFQVNTDRDQFRPESTGGNNVRTEAVYEDPKQSDSKLLAGVSKAGQNEVWMAVAMKLRGCNNTIRNSWWCPDAIGIGYNPSDWAAMGEPTVNATKDHTARFTTEDVSQDALAGTVTIKNHNWSGGAGCGAIPEAAANLTGRFKLRDGGEPTTLWGSYTHTFSYSPSGTIKSISGGSGGLGVSLTLDSTPAWSIAHPSDPEDVL